MLGFPIRLHHQHRFQHNQQWYVVDMEVGEVVKIDEVVHSILDCCEAYTFHELVERLKHRYPKHALFEGVRKLKRFAKLGLIVSQKASEPIFMKKNTSETRMRLFVLHSLDTPDPYPEESYALLRAMTEYVEMSYALFNTRELPPALQETDIHSFSIQAEGDHSLARCLESVASSHDALLLLYADSLKVLQLFECLQMPVITRVSNDIQGTTTVGRIHGIPKVETVINSTLAMHAAMRPFDAAVIDSPWLYQIFLQLLNQPEGIHFIPLPKQVEANRLPNRAVLSDLSNLFEVNLTSTSQGATDDANWNSIAKAFVHLLRELIDKRSACESVADVAFRFCQRYNPTSGKVSSQAVMFPSLLKHDMTRAIIKALSENHTKKEVDILREVFAV